MKPCTVSLAASSRDLLGKTVGAASERHEKDKRTDYSAAPLGEGPACGSLLPTERDEGVAVAEGGETGTIKCIFRKTSSPGFLHGNGGGERTGVAPEDSEKRNRTSLFDAAQVQAVETTVSSEVGPVQ